jgi:glycosyltransferase involved in cell wall biosynthesis
LFTCEEERVRARDVFKGHSYKERVVLFGTADPEGDQETQKEAFASAFPALRNRRFLLFLSRIHPKKGCDLMIEAFASLLPELPADLDLVIAGPDQVGWVPQLQSLANKLGIANRVHWPGMLKDDLKWGAFRSADALMLISHQENFGFVIPEAMACSTPVLISFEVNTWREVLAARAGLVAPDTPDGARKLITEFVHLSAEEREQMCRNARTGFQTYFDVNVTARDFMQAVGLGKGTSMSEEKEPRETPMGLPPLPNP